MYRLASLSVRCRSTVSLLSNYEKPDIYGWIEWNVSFCYDFKNTCWTNMYTCNFHIKVIGFIKNVSSSNWGWGQNSSGLGKNVVSFGVEDGC